MSAKDTGGAAVESAFTTIYMEPIFPHVDQCCVCDCDVELKVWSPNYSIAMYEGIPVPPEWNGLWGGFTACKNCYDKNERRELPMWTVEELEFVTSNAAMLAARKEAQ